MSTTSKDEHWLELITQCRASGLTDRQWCIENRIPVSTFYYHIRALRKKACEVPEAVETVGQKQEVVQIPLWEMEQQTSAPVAADRPSICLDMQGIRIEIHEQAGADVIRNTLLALRQLC
ncbi:IS66 family insertion sequence element accessory protein TnpA [Laedolimicola intestinihominis]|uniref:Transposase n=1 Tax=Laedolimicola intestinihominis TaxID=3133166 RepID=A0ABV1FI59_9FIRM